jgi:hypothetical protein
MCRRVVHFANIQANTRPSAPCLLSTYIAMLASATLRRVLVRAQSSSIPRGTLRARWRAGGDATALITAGGTYDLDGAMAVLVAWVAANVLPGAIRNLRTARGAAGARGRALVAGLAVAHRLCSASSVAGYFRRAKGTLSEQVNDGDACEARRSRDTRNPLAPNPRGTVVSAGSGHGERTLDGDSSPRCVSIAPTREALNLHATCRIDSSFRRRHYDIDRLSLRREA